MALPTDYANLSAWWSADSGYYNSYPTLATNGQSVTRWDDRSGNGRNFTAGSVGQVPTWQSNILNGQPVLRFTPNQDFYSPSGYTGQVAFNYTGQTYGTAFCVSRTTAATTYQPWIFWDGTYGTEATVQHNSAGTVQAYLYNTWTGTRPGTASAWGLITWLHSGTTLYCGNLDTRTASLTSVATAGVMYNGTMYLRSAGAFEYMEIAELVFYRRDLAESERMGVESYLAGKYGLSIPYGSGAFVMMT